MSTKYKFIDAGGCYFVTYATVNWVDIFTQNNYKDTGLVVRETPQVFGRVVLT